MVSLARLLNSGIARAVIARHTRFVTPGETLLLAQVPASAMGQALEILRGVPGEARSRLPWRLNVPSDGHSRLTLPDAAPDPAACEWPLHGLPQR